MENNVFKCPNCGNVLNQDGFCPNCAPIHYEEITSTEDEAKTKNKNKTFSTILCVLAGVNLVTGFGFIVPFLIIWFLFGAFGETEQYYGVIIGCLSYILASLVFLLSSIVNVIHGGYKNKNVILYTIIAFVISFLGGLLLFNFHDITSEHYNVVNGVKIYETEYDVIYQEAVIKDSKQVKIKLRYDSKSSGFSSVPFLTDKIKVNGKIVNCTERSDNYYGTVRYYIIQNEELEKNGITKINSISLLKYIGDEHYFEFNEYSEDMFEEVQIKFK